MADALTMPSIPRSDGEPMTAVSTRAARLVCGAQPVRAKPIHNPPSTTTTAAACARRDSHRRAAHASSDAPAMSCRVPVDGARCRYFTLTSTHPMSTSSPVRRSMGRAAPERRDSAIEMPALNRNSGNTSSARRKPCQSACTNWLGMAS